MMSSSLLTALLLCACCLGCFILLLRGTRKIIAVAYTDKAKGRALFIRAAAFLAAWLLLLGILSARGFFADFTKLPPRPGLAVLLPLPAVLMISFSKTGKALLRQAPPQWLIYLQSFRVFVELIIWLAVLRGLLPKQMSFEGRNFDIISGLLALPVGYYCFVKKRWPAVMVLLYNIVGLALLLNVLLISVLSMPTPLRAFHSGPDISLVAQFPFIFLPGFLVPLAYSLHIFSLRQWAMGRARRVAAA